MERGGRPWRELGIPLPAITSALAFFDGYRWQASPPICCRPSVTTSVRTPMSAAIVPAASFSILTGAAALPPHRPGIDFKLDSYTVRILPMTTRSTACTYVIFGATGNLSRIKLMPALYQLEAADKLSPTPAYWRWDGALESGTVYRAGTGGITEN